MTHGWLNLLQATYCWLSTRVHCTPAGGGGGGATLVRLCAWPLARLGNSAAVRAEILEALLEQCRLLGLALQITLELFDFARAS